MSKSQTGRKRATQAPSSTGQTETPPAPAARQTEPLRAESKSQTGRKRVTQAPSPTGQTEPLRVEPKSQAGRKRATQAPSPTAKSETPSAPAARETEPLSVEASGVPASLRLRREDRSPSSEQIAIRAYHLWVARGQPGGTDWDDWLEAERQLAASA